MSEVPLCRLSAAGDVRKPNSECRTEKNALNRSRKQKNAEKNVSDGRKRRFDGRKKRIHPMAERHPMAEHPMKEKEYILWPKEKNAEKKTCDGRNRTM